MKLIVYTKADCPLCDEGLREVQVVAERYGLEIEKVDVEGDSELFYTHRYRIPVVEFGGEELGWGRLDAGAMARRLAGRLPGPE
ncbi:MAG: glutaredoxin family protein [Planctomycetota bacterium]|nr:glutaredoxin family protein [Planctomycetota bacterium]